METWTTKEGDEIEYNKLEDGHLLNIIKFIERRAEEGVEVVYDYGYSGDDDFMTGDAETIYGEDVKLKLDWLGLMEEAKKRGLTPQ